MKFNGLFAHSGLYRINLHSLIPYRCGTVFQCLKTIQSCTLFGTSCTTSSFCPFDFHTENTLSFPLGCQFHFLSGSFHFQKTRITCLITVKFTMADLQDLVGNPVQKIAVMSNHDHHPFKTVQIIFQPGSHFVVQVVGRLIQNQHIRRIGKYCCQCYSFFLASGKMANLFFMIRNPQSVQDHMRLRFRIPAFICLSLCYIRKNRRSLRKLRMLGKISNTKPILGNDLTLICFFQTRQNP